MECQKGFAAVAHMFFANKLFPQNDPTNDVAKVPVQRGNILTPRPAFIENTGQQRLDYY